RFAVCLWETDISTIGTGITAPGIARMGAWRSPYYPDPDSRQFRRNGKASVPHPGNPQQYALVATDTEKYTAGGLQLEGQRTNWILNSAWNNALQQWPRTGQGVNGSVIILDLNDTAFDSILTPQSLQLHYGVLPAAADLHISQTVSFSGVSVTFSMIYKP